MSDDLILRHIFSRLAGSQNVALIVPSNRRASGLLRRIGDPKESLRWLPSTSLWIFAYVSAEQFEFDATASDFWQKVWQTFSEVSAGRPWQTQLIELNDRQSRRSSERLLRRFDAEAIRLVLLLNGMDMLVDRPQLFTLDLSSPLRTLSSRHPSFNIIFTSQHRLSDLNRRITAFGSPPFNNFHEILLSDYAVTSS
jgi:Cdc6-like AAA superfamily ATPase